MKTKTMKELTEKLASVFDELGDGKVDLKMAAEMNNTAGKIINTCRVQLEYAKLRKEKPTIVFLKDKQ